MMLEQDIQSSWQEVEAALLDWYEQCRRAMDSPQTFQTDISAERRFKQALQSLELQLSAASRLIEKRDEIEKLSIDVSQLMSTFQKQIIYLEAQKNELSRRAESLQVRQVAIGKREAERRMKRLHALGLAHIIYLARQQSPKDSLMLLHLAVEAANWGLIPLADSCLRRFLLALAYADTANVYAIQAAIESSSPVILYILQQIATEPEISHCLAVNATLKPLLDYLLHKT